MPYIGNTPALDYISFAVQNFTVTAGTTVYTLDYSVSNENDIALYINSVAQRPGASYAYSATGTTLTLTSATNAGDTMYAVFIGRAVQTVTPPASSVTNTMLSPSVITGQTAETSIAGGDSVLIYDDSASALRKMTRTNFVSGLSVDNTPSFFAYKTSNQAISANTDTKISFQSEGWDTDTAFDSTTNYRFTVPAGEGGKYFFFVRARFDNGTGNTLHRLILSLNGTQIEVAEDRQYTNSSGHEMFLQLSHIINLSAADYIEVNGRTSSSGVNILGSATLNDTRTFFTGFKLIGV